MTKDEQCSICKNATAAWNCLYCRKNACENCALEHTHLSNEEEEDHGSSYNDLL